MAELRQSPAGFALGFAGDSFNTAVYLRRLGAKVDYLTRVGMDPLSNGFLAAAEAEGVGTRAIRRETGRNLGIYAVATDAKGERSFSYWRAQSAARLMFQDAADLDALEAADVLVISGISLAILSPLARDALFTRIAALRPKLRLAFDSNFRPTLWEDAETARQVMRRAWALTDFALPSVDDEQALWGDNGAGAVLDRLRGWGLCDGVLKCGANGALPLDPNLPTPDLPPARKVVDTTAAGDSFNAGWLSARLAGRNSAIAEGHALACHVIGQPGAIVDMAGFQPTF